MRKTIDQRLAHAILLLNDKFGQNGDHFMKLRLSPQEFASFIGTTRTTIYRVFKRLEDEHLIEISNKRLRVLDDLALRSLAQNN
jgi:CRP/FNR family transcriptional regulator